MCVTHEECPRQLPRRVYSACPLRPLSTLYNSTHIAALAAASLLHHHIITSGRIQARGGAAPARRVTWPLTPPPTRPRSVSLPDLSRPQCTPIKSLNPP
eukprot:1172930-Prorocentrum_minimum.AAC.1